jgi:hypothetical protein
MLCPWSYFVLRLVVLRVVRGFRGLLLSRVLHVFAYIKYFRLRYAPQNIIRNPTAETYVL